MIRKDIDWATSPDRWAELWPSLPSGQLPSPFWYLYPSLGVAQDEFTYKWSTFLPKGEMKNHPQYGWKEIKERGIFRGISFNSGIDLLFKAYEQKAQNQQATSVYKISCDEELPVKFYDELMQRISGTEGYFDMACTGTLGQKFWWEAIECVGKQNERFPDALKLQVSKWDCLTYMDGSPSPWTPERIRKEEERCSSETQRLIRIEGKFIRDVDSLLPSFSVGNLIKQHTAQAGQQYYAAVYVGPYTGNGAMAMVALDADMMHASVLDAHGFDKDESDIEMYQKFLRMVGKHKLSGAFCNVLGGRSFIEVSRGREPYLEPSKPIKINHAKLLNSLFKYRMLTLTEEASSDEMVYHLQNASRKEEDYRGCEMAGALILACANINWNFNKVLGIFEKKVKPLEKEDRRHYYEGTGPYAVDRSSKDSTEDELQLANEEYENYGF
jgi:hypothetical protein